MVRIRYSDLPAGLHVSAKAEGRRTVIYLLPGLTPEQRKAALIRVRSGARMGYGPKLTPVGVTVAIAADRLRSTIRNGALAMRAHPLLLIPPLIVFVSAALVFVLLVSVSITFRPASPPAAVNSHPAGLRQHGGRGGNHGSAPAALAPGSTASPDPSSSPGRSHTPGHSASPSPSPTSSTPGSPSPQPSSPGASPSPSPSPSSSGLCLRVGPLGVCLPV